MTAERMTTYTDCMTMLSFRVDDRDAATGAHRKVRWADAPGGRVGEGPLDEAVLQTVVGEGHGDASGDQTVDRDGQEGSTT